MKKILVIGLIFVCVVVLFAGCAKESEYQPTEVENVSIRISNVSPTGATVIIKDTNEEPFVYGAWFQVEREKDGKWYEVEEIIDNAAFEAIGYVPNEDGELEFIIDWQWLYGKLPSGTYRLLKSVNAQCISITFQV